MERWGGPAGFYGSERKGAERLRQTVAVLPGEMLGELAHDARNMVAALELYCDLLEEPGVLAAPFHRYGSELRLVAASSRRLVEKLVALDREETTGRDGAGKIEEAVCGDAAATAGLAQRPRLDLPADETIDNLAAELESKRNLLAALAGPSVKLAMTTQGGALGVRLTREDLTRVLVNLVKNATEAMPSGGQISVNLDEFHAGAGNAAWLVLTVEDTGQGIPDGVIERIFDARFTTRSNLGSNGRPAASRGLGLSITRAIVEAAGGRIHAANRPQEGARFEIELPVHVR